MLILSIHVRKIVDLVGEVSHKSRHMILEIASFRRLILQVLDFAHRLSGRNDELHETEFQINEVIVVESLNVTGVDRVVVYSIRPEVLIQIM